MKKCHRCEKPAAGWMRGPLEFCSDDCRTASKNEGEPLEGWLAIGPGDDLIWFGTKKVGSEP